MEELDLKSIYTLLCRKKFYIIAVIILFIIFGTIYSYKLVVPDYKSSTTLILGRIVELEANNPTIVDNKITQSEITINSNLVSTYSELIKSKTLIKKVKNNLKIDISEEDLRESITVSRKAETELIEITVTNVSPEIASKIANEIAKVFSEKIQEIYNIQNVYIIDEATPDYEPYNVNHVKDITIFAVLGIIVAFGILVIYSISDTTIKSIEDIENEIGLKNLNVIPVRKKDYKKDALQSELITYDDTKSIASEAFRTLRTNIQFSNINNKENKILLVTSCFSSEGKSYVSANLAVAFAQAGKKVILIDADMRRGRQAKIFNLPNELGLSNYLSNLDRNGMEINERVNKYINETEIKNLNVITSGNVPPNPSELLTSNRLPELVKELGVFYDLIIFDGAPVLPIADSLILARMANSTVLVALYNKTKKDELLKAKKDIQNIDGRIIGTVLNKVPMTDYEYSSRYYYSSSEGERNNFFKKYEIRRQIKKEKKEYKKNEFTGLNFDRERKIKQRNYKILLLKNKIKEFFNRFKKTETKLLDMSKEAKEEYIRKQKRERQEQIKKEKLAKKLERKNNQSNQNKKDNQVDNSIKDENKNIEVSEEKQIEIEDVINIENNIINNNISLNSTDKLEENLDRQIKKIEEEINNTSNSNNQSEEDLSEGVDKKRIQKEEQRRIRKEEFKQKIEDIKKSIANGKKELVDLKNKLIEEYDARRQEVLAKRAEKKQERDAYNERKAQDKEEQEALKREENIRFEEQKEKERQEQEKVKEEERKLKEAEKELKRQEKEFLRKEQAQKRLVQKGLREAEKENKKKQKEALRMKQREETRIKEEILEDNLYPKTKYNKDI